MLETARLRLEPLAPAHADELFAVLDDERVSRHLAGPEVTTVEALRARIDRAGAGPPPGRDETWVNFAVRRRSDAQVLGRVEATVHGGWAEIAYVFGPAFWGRGYATEAVSWLLGWLCEAHTVVQVCASLDADNVSSRKLLDRLGFAVIEPPPHRPSSYDPGDLVMCREVGSAREPVPENR